MGQHRQYIQMLAKCVVMVPSCSCSRPTHQLDKIPQHYLYRGPRPWLSTARLMA
jgi:hypothetical protein